MQFKRKELLEFLLWKGADPDRAGDPVLELARTSGVNREILEPYRSES